MEDVLALSTNKSGMHRSRFERFIYEVCCKKCDEVVSMDVHPALLRAMAAAFNDDYLDVMVEQPVNQNVLEHIDNIVGFDDVFLLK